MKIGLIDVDGHNFPNLALMKISAFHKSNGDHVEWATIGKYDIIYQSKIFSFTAPLDNKLIQCKKIIYGGPGYNYNRLPDYIDLKQPDYSIYPKFKSAYGYLTRGCTNNCEWCIVPKIEGNIRPYRDTKETVFYLDPPYPGCNQKHYSGYSFKNLYDLLYRLTEIKGKFIISNFWSQTLRYFYLSHNWYINRIPGTINVNNLNGNEVKEKTEILMMNFPPPEIDALEQKLPFINHKNTS